MATPKAPGAGLRLLDLDDGVLAQVVDKLGIARRTAMLVCKRLRDLAAASVHSHQQPGQSVMDAVELAQPGDTLHLLPGFYKEALLLKKPLHLTCDGGEARILSPARFAVMVAAHGVLLENMVIKSHQIDESIFYLVEMGPACRYVGMRSCEVLQGSFVGIQDLKGPNTRMVLERCLLHVGISLMAGRLDATDCTIKGSGDSLLAEPGTTLVLRRCQFVDVADPLVIESSTAVVEGCKCWAYDRGPVVVTCGHNAEEAFDGHLNDEINSKILFLEDALPDLPVWISLHARIKATGTRASEAERAAVLRGELIEGKVVMWANSAFESRSNEGITAQQEEVRREARQMMLQMQRDFDGGEGLGGFSDSEGELSIGNSIEDPQSSSGEEDDSSEWESGSSDEDDPLFAPEYHGLEEHGEDVIDLVSSDSSGDSSSSGDSGTSHGGSDAPPGSAPGSPGGSSLDESGTSSDGSSQG